ncbi:hypothetical protein BH24ACT3_BH24ACT3_11100 [soil metagenome]
MFGEPIERGGVTVVPVAAVRGGAGAGAGGSDTGEVGGCGGFGVHARAVGVFVIGADGAVSWQPALDVTRIVLGAQAIAVVALRARRTRSRRRS